MSLSRALANMHPCICPSADNASHVLQGSTHLFQVGNGREVQKAMSMSGIFIKCPACSPRPAHLLHCSQGSIGPQVPQHAHDQPAGDAMLGLCLLQRLRRSSRACLLAMPKTGSKICSTA